VWWPDGALETKLSRDDLGFSATAKIGPAQQRWQ